jgi:hypothetical protein
MTSPLAATSSYSGASWTPYVASTAALAAAPQMDRCRPLAPMRFHNRRLATAICTLPSVPL